MKAETSGSRGCKEQFCRLSAARKRPGHKTGRSSMCWYLLNRKPKFALHIDGPLLLADAGFRHLSNVTKHGRGRLLSTEPGIRHVHGEGPLKPRKQTAVAQQTPNLDFTSEVGSHPAGGLRPPEMPRERTFGRSKQVRGEPLISVFAAGTPSVPVTAA